MDYSVLAQIWEIIGNFWYICILFFCPLAFETNWHFKNGLNLIKSFIFYQHVLLLKKSTSAT